MNDKLRKEVAENCAPQDAEIVTNTAILMLEEKQMREENRAH
jgi:hypothetical protein